MQNKILSVIFMMIIPLFLHSQTKIQGNLSDARTNLKLEKGSITIIKEQDSTLVTFKRTDAKGDFNLTVKDTGNYIVYATYPGFLGFSYSLKLTSAEKEITMDSIQLMKSDVLLGEVTIVDSKAITVNGDTIQYSADKFKTGKNANVEDLLKKLPGIEVNANGEIKAFGQRVEKVYVDGEEFFGNDPTIATRNIQAKAIDKVEVYDKKSAESELTGIDDGEKVKAINLKLKDAFKKGYFGKATVNGSPFSYYDQSLLAQYYKAKSKIGFYGILSNLGTTGLDFDDKSKYMGSSGFDMGGSDDGMMYYFSSNEDDMDWNGKYSGEGLPSSKLIGTSFSTKLIKEKLSINVNYGYSEKKIDLDKKLDSKYFLPDTSYYQLQEEQTIKSNKKHSATATFSYKADSLTTLTLNTSGSLTKALKTSNISTLNSSPNSRILSDIDRNMTNETDVASFQTSFKLEKKFMKPRRSIALNSSLNFDNSDGLKDVYSINNYSNISKIDTLNQQNTNKNNTNSKSISIVYSEPLDSKWQLQTSIKYQINNNLSDINAYGFDNFSNRFTRRLDTFSNDYNYKIIKSGAGLSMIRKTEKTTFRAGFEAERNQSFLNNLKTKNAFELIQIRIIPKLAYTIKLDRVTNLRFNYSGSTQPPTINNIQPINDNTDPLNLKIGNPNLLQAFNNRIGVSYNSWKSLSGQSIWSGINFSNSINQIVSNTTIDAQGRNITNYENTNGNYSISSYFNYNKRLSKLFSFGIGGDFSLNQHVSIINSVKSQVKVGSINPSFSVEFEKEEKFDFEIEFKPTWNTTTGGLVNRLGDYYANEITGNFDYDFTKKIKLNSNVEYIFKNAQSSFNEDFKRLIWNADLSYNFLKDESMILKVGIHDIFNQNLGIEREITSFVTTQNTYNTIRRYANIALIYNFKSKIKEESDETK
jgi:Outer membrane protein beta-barrel family